MKLKSWIKNHKKITVILIIFLTLLVIFLIGTLVFLLPIFKTNYLYNEDNNNYTMKVNTTFRQNWFNCIVTEKVNIDSENKLIEESLSKDLIKDNYKKKDNYYVRSINYINSCSKIKSNYKKIHNDNYAKFKYDGELNEKLLVKSNYVEKDVTSIVSNKKYKNIKKESNLNINKIGKYIIKYTIKINDNYKKHLYKTIEVYDDESPVITLKGNSVVNLNINSKYKESGYSASDNYDGDLTSSIKIDSSVDTSKKGNYTIIYSVTDSSNNKTEVTRLVRVIDSYTSSNVTEPTYIKGILLVNKKYALPSNYNPGVNSEASAALQKMRADASILGYILEFLSGFRSYNTQVDLYNKYVAKDGQALADTYSARPGHSEHQTGLAFDIGSLYTSFGTTEAGKWLANNCHLYGFIIRYPEGKTNITGYQYEPWHVRYLGIDTATKVKQSGLTLEEYLGVN